MRVPISFQSRAALRSIAELSVMSHRKPLWKGQKVYVEYRRCNRQGCTRCPHGPYVYLHSEGRRTYVGPLHSI